MTRTFLAAVGDANDIRTYSGTPYHLLLEGRRCGVIDAGLPLHTGHWIWSARRYAWNLGQVLQGRGRGGYQYSAEFLERLWAPFRAQVKGAQIINCFPLYPPSLVADGAAELWFYLDQTLLQLFDAYGIRQFIGHSIAEDALTRERIGYECAAGVVTCSHWAAESVIRDYDISPEKISVVSPGANLNFRAYSRWADTYNVRTQFARATDSPLRLVFVGKEPARKGLDRLLRAIRLARARGASCTLRIIGCRPEELAIELREIPGVEWAGFIDKGRDPAVYLNAVADCDVGCLLSRAEASAIGLREYHALGLAVIGPDVGGSRDQVILQAARLMPPNAPDEDIAALILALDQDRAEVSRMRAVSWERRQEMSWANSVAKLATVMERTKG